MVGGSVPEVAIRAVDGANGAAEPVPLFASEVRHVDIGVLQEGQQNEEHVHDQVWHQVVRRHGDKACATQKIRNDQVRS